VDVVERHLQTPGAVQGSQTLQIGRGRSVQS
jgi:hypothetical protein